MLELLWLVLTLLLSSAVGTAHDLHVGLDGVITAWQPGSALHDCS